MVKFLKEQSKYSDLPDLSILLIGAQNYYSYFHNPMPDFIVLHYEMI